MAREAGFEHESTIDLTPLLEMNRCATARSPPASRCSSGCRSTGERFDYVIGGDALQTCLAKGWIRYELNVFRAR